MFGLDKVLDKGTKYNIQSKLENKLDLEKKIKTKAFTIKALLQAYAKYLKYEKRLDLTTTKEKVNLLLNELIEKENIGNSLIVNEINKFIIDLYKPIKANHLLESELLNYINKEDIDKEIFYKLVDEFRQLNYLDKSFRRDL